MVVVEDDLRESQSSISGAQNEWIRLPTHLFEVAAEFALQEIRIAFEECQQKRVELLYRVSMTLSTNYKDQHRHDRSYTEIEDGPRALAQKSGS